MTWPGVVDSPKRGGSDRVNVRTYDVDAGEPDGCKKEATGRGVVHSGHRRFANPNRIDDECQISVALTLGRLTVGMSNGKTAPSLDLTSNGKLMP
uniref:Uncharacterized protein n=1 Tax=Leersia perrieri TaxID=77586 RepID=A0A0D9W0K5_9ORYZ